MNSKTPCISGEAHMQLMIGSWNSQFQDPKYRKKNWQKIQELYILKYNESFWETDVLFIKPTDSKYISLTCFYYWQYLIVQKRSDKLVIK